MLLSFKRSNYIIQCGEAHIVHVFHLSRWTELLDGHLFSALSRGLGLLFLSPLLSCIVNSRDWWYAVLQNLFLFTLVFLCPCFFDVFVDSLIIYLLYVYCCIVVMVTQIFLVLKVTIIICIRVFITPTYLLCLFWDLTLHFGISAHQGHIVSKLHSSHSWGYKLLYPGKDCFVMFFHSKGA